MNFDSLTSGFNLLIAISAGVPAALAIIWAIVKFIKYHRKTVKTIYSISDQFSKNGGNSLRDAIDDMRATINRVDDAVSITHASHNTAVNYLGIIIFTADIDGLITSVSDAWVNITGHPASSALKNGWRVAIHEEDLDELVKSWEHFIRDKRSFRHTFRFESTTGKITKVLSTAEPIKDMTGNVIGFVGCCKLV